MTTRAYCGEVGVRMPSRPLGLLLLVYVSIQSEEAAKYADLRAEFDLENASTLTNAITPLVKAKLVTSTQTGAKGGRELRLTDLGWNAVGKLLVKSTARPAAV